MTGEPLRLSRIVSVRAPRGGHKVTRDDFEGEVNKRLALRMRFRCCDAAEQRLASAYVTDQLTARKSRKKAADGTTPTRGREKTGHARDATVTSALALARHHCDRDRSEARERR